MNATSSTAEKASVFEGHRSYLRSLAYRMVGTTTDAEDIVQDAWFRWHDAAVEELRSARAWLTTVVTRLCLDHLRTRRSRREDYVGPWLPEALVTDDGSATTREAELGRDLSYALLVMLERLTPAQRAAYLLREIFDHDYPDIAEVLGRDERDCRQLVHRAKVSLHADRPRFAVDSGQVERLLEGFTAALATGDATQLAGLFIPEVALTSDGGGKVSAATKPLQGVRAVTRFLLGLRASAPPGFVMERRTLNGAPGLVGWIDGEPAFTMSMAVSDDRIAALYFVRNPDKLRRLALSASSHSSEEFAR